MRYHNNEHDARASYNLAFMKIIKNLDSLNWEEVSFAAWIRKVMNNTLIDEYRKVKRQRERYPSKETDRELEYHSNGSKNKALSNIGEGEILNLLNLLNPDRKRVFMLYAIEGYSHKEISEIMGIPEGTSKWHLSNARKELKVMIEKLERIELKNIAI
jgi:RNA polymerase sigma-70 factor (ECF subfamily)